jgi:hypothetical protein
MSAYSVITSLLSVITGAYRSALSEQDFTTILLLYICLLRDNKTSQYHNSHVPISAITRRPYIVYQVPPCKRHVFTNKIICRAASNEITKARRIQQACLNPDRSTADAPSTGLNDLLQACDEPDIEHILLVIHFGNLTFF